MQGVLAVRDGFSALAGAASRAGSVAKSVLGGVQTACTAVTMALGPLFLAMKGIQLAANSLVMPSQLAASAETTAVSFRTLVGDTKKADAALEDITKLAASTPFEFPELAGAARSLVAFGEDSKDVASVLRRIGDVASGVNTPIGDLAAIYGKARVAGTLMADDINQLLERGIPILQEFARQTGKSAGEIKDMASKGEITFPMLEQAFISLTSGAGKFSGMMAQASATMEGKLSTLGDSWKGVMTAVGVGLNEALKPIVGIMSDKLDTLKEKAQSLGQTLGNSITFTTRAFEDGKVGDLIVAGFKAGGLVVLDKLVKAFEWGGSYLASTLVKYNPFGSDESKAEATDAQNRLREGGLDTPGLGLKSLSDAANEARDALTNLVGDIQRKIDTNRALAEGAKMRAEILTKQKRDYNEQQANEAKIKSDKEAAAKKAELSNLLPAPVLPYDEQGPGVPDRKEEAKEKAAADKQAKKDQSARDRLLKQKGHIMRAPGAERTRVPDAPGFGDMGEEGGGREATGRPRIRRKSVVETIRNSWNRADKDKRGNFNDYAAKFMGTAGVNRLTPDQRAQLYAPMAGKKGRSAAAQQQDAANSAAASSAVAVQAAQVVINLLPEINKTLSRLHAA